MGNKAIGLRIEQCRKSRDLTLKQIADEIGVVQSTVQRYEKGTIETVKRPVIEAIARVLDVNPDWLLCKSDDMNPSHEHAILLSNIIPLPKSRSYPLVGTIACGEPILAEENISEYIEFPGDIDADFCLRCQGDSMINARIHDGDIVFIRKQESVENGEIAAVRIGDEATLKKVYIVPGSNRVILRACNPLFPDREFEGNTLNDMQILGKAIAFASTIK